MDIIFFTFVFYFTGAGRLYGEGEGMFVWNSCLFMDSTEITLASIHGRLNTAIFYVKMKHCFKRTKIYKLRKAVLHK